MNKFRIMSLSIQIKESVGIFVETIMVSCGWKKIFYAASLNVMLVSTGKSVYNSTCKSANLQLPSDNLELRNSPSKSDIRIILNLRTILREMTSELGTLLRKQFQPLLISSGLSVRSSLWKKYINWIISAARGFKISDWININWFNRSIKDI